MEIIGGEEFERGLRAALASRRLLACCKVLQARMSEQLHAAYYRRKVPLTSLKSHFKDPVVAEVYAVIALAEGRDAAADPFLGWSLRAIAFSAERSPDPYAYVPDKSFDALEAAGIATVGDLLGRTAGDVLGILGMGPTLLEQLENELRSHGLALAERSDRARAI